jgi:DNA repair exonuclease SbcCD nuclease subunit
MKQLLCSVGDIHGNFDTLKYLLKMKNACDCNILACGDIGIGFHKPNYYKQTFSILNDFCIDKNINIYAVRGNHDDPSYFNNDSGYSNIHLVQDYTCINIDGLNVLFIGGGISIDRKLRLADKNKVLYWENEKPIYDEEKLEAIQSQNKIDIIVSHTAPKFVFPYSKGSIVYQYAEHDDMLLSDCEYERNVYNSIFYYLLEHNNLPSFWCYGHFHQHNKEILDGLTYICNDVLDFNMIATPQNI